jgi:3',5'-nucleoside bisphosphate phosphatase
MIDLHTHTYYSDGRYSPAEVIEAAAQRGVSILAITDHDNTNGSREAAPLAEAAGIELIHAIEFTTRWPGAELPPADANVDLLGYFIDPGNAELRAFEEASLNDIHVRIADCCKWLTLNGYPLNMEDIHLENPRYGGTMQTIQAIMRKGYAPTWKDGFRLMDTVWLTARESPFTIKSAIEQIHLAGGVAVLAHPSIVRPRGQPLSAGYLRDLVEAGLDGIEIYHHRLDEAARAYFLDLARTFGLLVTGGSDMHGWSRGFEELGGQPVTIEMVDDLRKRSQAWRQSNIRKVE